MDTDETRFTQTTTPRAAVTVRRWDRAVKGGTGALMRSLPAAVAGAPEAIHRARVASRRARELLALVDQVGSKVDTPTAVRRLRRVRRLLGPVRELDVGRDLLDELARAHPELSGEIQAAKGRLADARHERAEKLRRAGAGLVRKLGTRLTRVSRRAGVDATPAEIRRAVARQIARRKRRLLLKMDEARQLRKPRRLHEVRIAVKRLRYSAELAAQVTGVAAHGPLTTLEGVQALLGRIHDLHVLAGHLRKRDRPGCERTLALIHAEMRVLHADYLRHRSGLRRAAVACERTFSRAGS